MNQTHCWRGASRQRGEVGIARSTSVHRKCTDRRRVRSSARSPCLYIPSGGAPMALVTPSRTANETMRQGLRHQHRYMGDDLFGGLGQPGVEGDQLRTAFCGDREIRGVVGGDVVAHPPNRLQ